MNFKHLVEDWPMVKRRWAAWWERRIIDRPLMCVVVNCESQAQGRDLLNRSA